MVRIKPWCDYVKVKKVKVSKTRLKAKWIDVSDATTDDGGRDWHIREYKCSNCKLIFRMYNVPYYCSNCGARMVKK